MQIDYIDAAEEIYGIGLLVSQGLENSPGRGVFPPVADIVWVLPWIRRAVSAMGAGSDSEDGGHVLITVMAGLGHRRDESEGPYCGAGNPFPGDRCEQAATT
jgi:hypothetical protein